jgi:outer membrane protein assembly factor BamB
MTGMDNWAKTIAVCIIVLLFLPTLAMAKADGIWETKPPIPQQGIIGGGAAVACDGKIFLLGGDGESLYAYEPVDGTCVQKADLQIPFENEGKGDSYISGVASIQNQIYVIAGIQKNRQDKTFSVVKIYNATDNTWRDGKAPPHTVLYLPIVGAINGKIYLIDGETGFNEVYDPSSNSWTVKNPLPFWYVFFGQRQEPVLLSTVLGDKIYCFTAPETSPTKTLIYNTKTDSWTLGVELPLGENSFSNVINMAAVFIDSTTGVYAPQRIYLMGAFFDGHTAEFSKLSYIFNPQNESWYSENSWSAEQVQGDAVSSNYFNYVGAVLNDKIYLIGYNGSSGYEVKRYIPSGYNETPLPPTPMHNQPENPLPRLDTVEFIVGLSLLAIIAVCILRFKKNQKR